MNISISNLQTYIELTLYNELNSLFLNAIGSAGSTGIFVAMDGVVYWIEDEL